MTGILMPHRASAAVTLVNSNSSSGGSSPVAVSYPSAAVAGNLLVVVCSSRGAATYTAPSGFSTAINESTDPSEGIFYKVAAGGETSESCSYTGSPANTAIQILQYGGIENVSPLNAVTAGGSTGTGTTASTGSLTTANPNDLLVAAIVDDTNTTVSAWGSSFASRTGSTIGGAQSGRMAYATADYLASATGSYSTTATVGNAAWRGQLAAFKIAPTVDFSVDIVDSSGTTVTSPAVSMSTLPTNFTCQTSSGTLGISTQKIRVTNTNPADSNGWTLGIAATAGSNATWTAGAQKLDYNDAGSSGCSDSDSDGAAGQLSINPASEVITPESSPETGCTTTGVSPLGSTTAFAAAQSSITLATAGSTSSHYCYWDITGLGLHQTIPAKQASGAYSIGLTLTLTAL